MSVVYFKSNQASIYILITYKYLKKSQKVILNKIKFFHDENETLAYIKQKELTIVDNSLIKNLQELINDYLSGKNINLYEKLKDHNIDLQLKEKFPTSFSQKIINYLIVHVPYGRITTYSDIGNNIGSKAFRAIGNTLRNNPLPLLIPCHRVIKKNGEIGGFMGKIDNKWQHKLKNKILEIEGLIPLKNQILITD